MKANQDKCHLIIIKNDNVLMYIGPFEIKNTNSELLGIKVESRLNFNEHLDGIIKKASRKINTLSRITPFMNITKRRNKINRLHERVLRIVYSNFKSSFEKDGTVSIHAKNLQILAT